MDWHIPYLTSELPGIGGKLRVLPEDFVVEEVPAYEPSGEGEHTFFGVEKRGISTPVLVQKVARALDVPPKGISYAGMKDARAVTRQTLCVHAVPPERLLSLELEDAQVLWAKRHRNKLRIGHLKGNRFTLRIRDVHADAEPRAVAILDVLASQGVPNGYGVQRFGNRGNNHEIGYLLLRKDKAALRAQGIGSLPFRRYRFYLSALQSALFNRYLSERLRQGKMDCLLTGDVVKKHTTGGIFTVEDADVEQPRAAAWELSPTGPIYGYKMMRAQGEAADLEVAVLDEAGLTLEDFRSVKSKGSRRYLRYQPEGLHWEMAGTDLLISFFAPKGSFATMLLRELLKTEVISDEEDEEDG